MWSFFFVFIIKYYVHLAIIWEFAHIRVVSRWRHSLCRFQCNFHERFNWIAFDIISASFLSFFCFVHFPLFGFCAQVFAHSLNASVWAINIIFLIKKVTKQASRIILQVHSSIQNSIKCHKLAYTFHTPPPVYPAARLRLWFFVFVNIFYIYLCFFTLSAGSHHVGCLFFFYSQCHSHNPQRTDK